MKLFIKTFGCQSNEYDSFRIYDFLRRFFKCQLVYTYKDAEISFVNVCTVREKVEKKSFDFIKMLCYYKIEQSKNLIIICSGCISLENLIREYVDLIIYPQHLHTLPNLLIKLIKERDYPYKVSYFFKDLDCRSSDFFLSYYPKYHAFKNIVYIPISEGCNNYCSFCAVPYSRGPEVCRTKESILLDIKYYVKNNVQEVILLGHNVNSYLDKDFVPFHSLLYTIMKINGLKRVCFLTANPKDFTFELLNLYESSNDNLSNHLHLPLQSGSDNILKKMRRGYTIDQYRDIVFSLRKRRPSISITTDLIVGFPGETTNDFLQTLACVNEFSFDSSFCFMYSPRENTLSKKYLDNVEFAVKLKRLNVLQNTLFKSVQKNISNLINTVRFILVYGLIKKNVYWGKTDCNRTTLFESLKKYENGIFVRVFILSNVNNTLLAKIY